MLENEQNPKTQVKSGSSHPVMAFAMLRRTRRPGSSSRRNNGRKRDERRNLFGFCVRKQLKENPRNMSIARLMSINTTYWCVRNINSIHNHLYCEYATGMLTYFNLKVDPFQLRNILTPWQTLNSTICTGRWHSWGTTQGRNFFAGCRSTNWGN